MESHGLRVAEDTPVRVGQSRANGLARNFRRLVRTADLTKEQQAPSDSPTILQSLA